MRKYKVYLVVIAALVLFCVSICFVPLNATKFIPLIEEQAYKDFGVKVHIEKLIFRFGPSLKVKAPVMHIMYEDGQKFAQFDNVKFYIPWSSIFNKDDVRVKKIFATQLIVKINSNDKYLPQLTEKFADKEFKEIPNVFWKNYSVSYKDADNNEIYKTIGHDFEAEKVSKYSNFKFKSIGAFYVNHKPYITYDVSVLPQLEIDNDLIKNFDFKYFAEQLKALDFHSDIIADLKLYKNMNDETLISGYVNVDNISVLDAEKKNPKSFVYLTFLGNKIGVLSNLYATADKKVYVDGVINTSKKPELDLKVKTDTIDLSSLYKKVKLLVDCSQYKGINIESGTLNADFIIKGDISKIKSSGFLKLANASIKSNSVNINKIDANIDFSNNTVNISNAVGYVNKAPITLKGKIDKNIDLELLMQNVELKHLFPENFGIKNGVMSLIANFSGTFSEPIHKENLAIENFRMIKDENVLEFSNLKINTNKDNVATIANLLITPKSTEFIKLPMLKLHINGDKVTIPSANIFMPNSHLTVQGEVLNFQNQNLTFNTLFKGNINTKDIKNFPLESYSYPVVLTINGNRDVQSIESQVNVENARILDEPTQIKLSAKFENKSLKIDDLSISPLTSNKKNSKKVIITGIVEDIANPSFKNVRFYIPQLLNVTFMDNVAQLKGDLFINGKLSQPDIVGQLTIQNLVNQCLHLSINSLTADFNKNVAIVNAPNIKLSDSSLGFTGTFSTDLTNSLLAKSVNIKSKFINSDTLLMYKDIPFVKNVKFDVNDGKFYAEKAYCGIYGSPLSLTALSFDFSLKDDIVSGKNLSSELYNGKIAGALNFNLKDENFATKLQARGVSAAPIFDVVAIKKDSVSGVMDFDTNLSGNLSSKASLNGNIKFIVHNGRMGTLGKLEHLLYAQNVIADNMLRTSLSVVTKAITLKDTGLFKYLRGDITMKNGVANINYMQSQGPLMSMFIKGQYNPSTDYAKLFVLGRLSDEIVSGLGAFGDFSLNKLMVMLTGEETKYSIKAEDIEKLPPLPMKNTKEFRCIINGILEKPSSVLLFNWISYSQKSYRQKDVPMSDTKLPDFIDSLPY